MPRCYVPPKELTPDEQAQADIAAAERGALNARLFVVLVALIAIAAVTFLTNP